MTDHSDAVAGRLENGSVLLAWGDDALYVTNKLSGSTRRFSFPAFALRIGGKDLTPEDFSLILRQEEAQGQVFVYRCDRAGISAEVRYFLEGEMPWFRKTLTLTAPQGMPTPDRVWVDVQDAPPTPRRRVGYGLRGGPEAEEQKALDTYGSGGQAGCGYPVYVGDWFCGLEHPTGFCLPGNRLQLYHHPVWDEGGVIRSFPAVFGAAFDHKSVPQAFMDYVWHIRLPRLERPFITVSAGWSTRAIGAGEYLDSFETHEAFLRGLQELGLHPDALALDAGYFERRSLYRHKGDDEQDTRFRQFSDWVREQGFSLSLWVSHNGRTGLDMDWVRQQGWLTGDGPGTYTGLDFVVMMQPEFEDAIARRFEQLVGDIGAVHLKIDWDNECATCGAFSDKYPTHDHVREASVLAFNRIDRRLRNRSPQLITRNGWWPSPWWLCWANHVWLVDSGDGEYAAWPSRTQRDRDNTHRDAMYYQITRRAETPVPLDAYDNHGFAHALDNPFSDEPHTWLDNAVLAFTRGTTYLHMPICPEGLRQWQADSLQGVLNWLCDHAHELGVKGTRMVGGHPGYGEVYGFLHPSEDSAWLMLRNPSPQPQPTTLPLGQWLDWAPGTMRQVYPFWQELSPLSRLMLLGHEVCLLRLEREPSPDPSPIAGVPFMVQAVDGQFEYLVPGTRTLAEGIGPTVHPYMQIRELSVEKTKDGPIEGGRRLQWFLGVPHRFERAEVIVTLRGAAEALDGITLQAGC